MSEAEGEQPARDERQLRRRLRLTLRQIFVQKGWDYLCRLEGNESVAELRMGQNTLTVRGGIFGEALNFIEGVFQSATEIEIALSTSSDYGLTNSYIVRESGEDSFEGARYWAEQIAMEQEEQMDKNGVIDFRYEGAAVKLASFLDVVSDPGFKGRVRPANDGERAYLESRGFENQGEFHSNVKEEDTSDLSSILKVLVARFKQAPPISPKAVKKAAKAGTNEQMTPLAALNLDLNSLGSALEDFRLDGGKLKSKRAAKGISAWFPRTKMSPEEMCQHLTQEIEKRGRFAVEGVRSARGLAIGLMASRRGQIKVFLS